MRIGNLIMAACIGFLLGQVAYREISPKSEVLRFHPNMKGEYVDSLEEDTYRAEIKERSDGVMVIHYEPLKKWSHYLISLAIAIGVGVLHYRNLQAQAKREQERKEREKQGFRPEVDDTPNEDPLYEEFLQENSNRRFVPRDVLEEEFQVWQLERKKPAETQT